LFIAALSATGLYFRNKNAKTADPIDKLTIVEGVLAPVEGQQHDDPEKPAATLGSSTFFLKPSASEILTALRESGPFDSELPTEAGASLQVVWPGYFFSLQEDKTGVGIVHLDVDENGFGTILRCLINLSDYPQLRSLEQGRKIWVAGRLAGIDPAGDGIITIDVQYVRFDDELEQSLPPENE
ncbi:MAG: hypothetical protein IH612_03280, partial [Desulfofustis sp.]|nr:hypothetical protein [Desulfofustis sp.]